MTSSQTRIAFFGECMIELSGEPIRKGFGGDTLNTALYLSRLTEESHVQVLYATGLGDDLLSEELLCKWQQEGINTELVEIFPNQLPGLYLVSTDESGERSFLYWRDNAAVKRYFSMSSLNKLEAAMECSALDYVYVSGISLAILDDCSKKRLIEALKQFSIAGGKVIFDNNFRPQLWSTDQAHYWYNQLLPFVDIALITEDDDIQIWGDIESCEERYLRLGCKEIVIKRGSQPCQLIWSREDAFQYGSVDAQVVEDVVDTCAAGDSFAAGYLAGRMTGQNCESSAKLGHALASVVIQHPGAIIPQGAMTHLIR